MLARGQNGNFESVFGDINTHKRGRRLSHKKSSSAERKHSCVYELESSGNCSVLSQEREWRSRLRGGFKEPNHDRSTTPRMHQSSYDVDAIKNIQEHKEHEEKKILCVLCALCGSTLQWYCTQYLQSNYPR